MSRDILVCMVRAREWRRQHYTIDEPGTTIWTASQTIELAEGETLDGLWVSASARSMAVANDPTGVQGVLPLNRLPNTLRVGLLWVDNPLTQLDPISSLADPLWVSMVAWDWRPIMIMWPSSIDPSVQRTQWMWICSWSLNPVKAEGKRLVGPGQGTRWLVLCGRESGPGSGAEYGSFLMLNMVVSALVLLPGEE